MQPIQHKLLEPPRRAASSGRVHYARSAINGSRRAQRTLMAAGLSKPRDSWPPGRFRLDSSPHPSTPVAGTSLFALIGTMIGSSEAVAAPPPSGMACRSQAWDAAQPLTAGGRLSCRLRRNALPGGAELGRGAEVKRTGGHAAVAAPRRGVAEARRRRGRAEEPRRSRELPPSPPVHGQPRTLAERHLAACFNCLCVIQLTRPYCGDKFLAFNNL